MKNLKEYLIQIGKEMGSSRVAKISLMRKGEARNVFTIL